MTGLALVLALAQLLLVAAMGCALWRLARGPRAQDRILALDAFYVDGLLLLLSIALSTGSVLYAELAVVIALVGFAGSTALAKFLLRGEVIE